MYDSERDSFMMAFKALGYSMNTDNQDEIQEAYQWLLDMNNTMEPVYVTDEVIDGMINGTKGHRSCLQRRRNNHSGRKPRHELLDAYRRHKPVERCYGYPCKRRKSPKLAHEFINYVLTYEASLGQQRIRWLRFFQPGSSG